MPHGPQGREATKPIPLPVVRASSEAGPSGPRSAGAGESPSPVARPTPVSSTNTCTQHVDFDNFLHGSDEAEPEAEGDIAVAYQQASDSSRAEMLGRLVIVHSLRLGILQ